MKFLKKENFTNCLQVYIQNKRNNLFDIFILIFLHKDAFKLILILKKYVYFFV